MITDEMVEAAAVTFGSTMQSITGDDFTAVWAKAKPAEKVGVLTAFRAALEAAERAAWRPISEAPKDGRWFLAGEATTYDLVGGHTFHATTARYEYPTDDAPEVMRANGYDAGPTWPTHFRPLPTPPEAA